MQRARPADTPSQPPVRRKKLHEKSFRELFTRDELALYGTAIIVYILLGLAFRDKVLNVGIGPLFFIVWIWVVPPAAERLRKRFLGK